MQQLFDKIAYTGRKMPKTYSLFLDTFMIIPSYKRAFTLFLCALLPICIVMPTLAKELDAQPYATSHWRAATGRPAAR
ncbi:MAG: hypothetical protein KDE54_12500, partial [Caldilineaceae bacterium]|nr:hypothetical protein [Caldilineaceae bacterium]MCB0140552.1 hypothetical protein [Caldilineaceae bacterium]